MLLLGDITLVNYGEWYRNEYIIIDNIRITNGQLNEFNNSKKQKLTQRIINVRICRVL